MSKTNDIELLDELLNSDPFFLGLDRMAADYPACTEAMAAFDRALEGVKSRMDFREWDAIDSANTTCNIAYAQLGVLFGMQILSIFQNGMTNAQALGDLIVQRMRKAKEA